MNHQKFIILSSLLLFMGIQTAFGLDKTYHKSYFPDGQLKAEGWLEGSQKTEFWIFYHPNGKVAAKGHYKSDKMHGYWHFYRHNGEIEKEGHFIAGSSENWWIFYELGTLKKSKFQFKNNRKNGFCLRYEGRKLVRAEKYEDGQKVGQWTSLRAFKRDNPGVSLR